MSVDTLGFPNRRVTTVEVLGFIRATYDKGATLEPLHVVLYDDYSLAKGGVIHFKFTEEESRLLWIFPHPEDSKGYPDVPHPKAPYTVFNFGKWGHSEEIMANLLAAVGGGYVVPSDWNIDEYYYVEPDPTAFEKYYEEIPHIVTMADIKKAFGENAILDLGVGGK